MIRTNIARVLRLSNRQCVQISEFSTATTISADDHFPETWNDAKPYDSIPGPKPLPIIGNSWRMMLNWENNTKFPEGMHKKYGDIVLFKKLMQFGDMIFLFNVRDIEWVFRNEGAWPIRDAFESNIYYRHTLRKDIFGEPLGLVNTHNEAWASFRNAVNPILMQPRTTHQYIPQINEIGDEFLARIRKLKEKSPVSEMPDNFMDELNRWSFESITAIALDTRLGCLKDQPSEKAEMAIFYILQSFDMFLELDFMPHGKYLRKFNTPYWKRFVKGQDYFTFMVLDLIEEAQAKIKNDPDYATKPEHEKSVFERLVAKDKRVAMVMTLDMMAAGIDTTSKITGAVLYFLAKNPEVQEKLRKELKRLMPTKSTPLTKNILDEASYLRACIKESTRIAPIGPGNLRRTTKPMVIGGYQIPEGTALNLPHLYLSLGDLHYSDPEVYRPERWIRSEKTEKVNPFASLPFGFGARSCIGKRMANMEIEVLVSKMVRSFKMSWPHKDMTFKQHLLYGIGDPLKLRLEDVQD